MARIRTIKPEFPQSESMGRVSREARLCFVLIWTLVDDSGRARGNSRMLASLLYPYDDDAKDHIDGWLTELCSEGCLARYEVSGASYIQVLNWDKHQKIDRPSPSKHPEFDESSRILANPSESSMLDMDLGPRTKERTKERIGEGSAEPQSDSPPTSPQVASLPLNDGTEHPFDAEQLREWIETYPAVDVPQQLREMRAWCQANPSHRKTRRGIRAFVVRWLGKEQDRAPCQSMPIANPRSFAERDRDAGMQRWEQMTGRVHPDRSKAATVIDITPAAPALKGSRELAGSGH